MQVFAGDGARLGHEMAREGAHLVHLDADREAGRHVQVFGSRQVVEHEVDGNGAAAGDQDFGMLVAQQVVQAREKAFDLVFALRHFGGLVALQYVGAGGGRHAQGLDEQARQRAHAEKHGQFVVGRNPAVLAQDRLAARGAQGQAAFGAITGFAGIFMLAARTPDAAKSKHLEHRELLVV